MADSNLISDKVLTIIGVGASIVSLFSEEYRAFGIVVGTIFLIIYQEKSKISEIESLKARCARIEERTDIIKELAELKSEIKHIKEARR